MTPLEPASERVHDSSSKLESTVIEQTDGPSSLVPVSIHNPKSHSSR